MITCCRDAAYVKSKMLLSMLFRFAVCQMNRLPFSSRTTLMISLVFLFSSHAYFPLEWLILQFFFKHKTHLPLLSPDWSSTPRSRGDTWAFAIHWMKTVKCGWQLQQPVSGPFSLYYFATYKKPPFLRRHRLVLPGAGRWRCSVPYFKKCCWKLIYKLVPNAACAVSGCFI